MKPTGGGNGDSREVGGAGGGWGRRVISKGTFLAFAHSVALANTEVLWVLILLLPRGKL